MFCLACIFIHHVSAVLMEVSKRGQILLNESYKCCAPPCGFWELNPGLLQEQQVLLTTEPSF